MHVRVALGNLEVPLETFVGLKNAIICVYFDILVVCGLIWRAEQIHENTRYKLHTLCPVP